MRNTYWLPAAALVVVLSGCSGGGGGISSTPAPTPTPTPTPANSTISNLRADQTFSDASASTSTVFDTATSTVTHGNSVSSTVQVSYNAAARSYTITTQGRTQSFAPVDVQATGNVGETRYVKTDGTTRDYLTLVTTPYTGATGNQYVGMGYWQRNTSGAGTQNTLFDMFTYGLDTPAVAIPRTGSVAWKTDIFGLLTIPAARPLTIQGSGSFNVDFLSGLFSTTAFVDEYDFINGGGTAGSLELTGGGHLGSGNSFSGNIFYDDRTVALGGTITGKFYGPGAEEIGASFSAHDSSGDALTGSMTGQRDPSQPAVNLALTNVVATQRLRTQPAGTSTVQNDGAGGYSDIRSPGNEGFFTIQADGGALIDNSFGSATTLTAADQVTGRPNFTTYHKTVDGQPVTIELYRPGNANTELALTYASFGTWSSSFHTGTVGSGQTSTNKLFFLYGLGTPRDQLTQRTGTGRYDGVVYASGASMDGRSYDVGGSSRFDVDFSAQHYTGSLTLTGTQAGSAATAFGTWTFGANMGYGEMSQAMPGNGVSVGNVNSIQPYFYGPDGEEIGAVFKVFTGPASAASSVQISGVTVAKRQ